MATDTAALRRVALRAGGDAGPTDADLLDDFLAHRDEVAFEALVRRHGPMVLGVCRRVLGNEADAEDAFQATFLVLVRKANTIVPRSRVGNWLYGVAHHTARKARAMNQSRRTREQRPRPAAAEAADAPGPEEMAALLALLDRELAGLPDVYREAVVLCELEGKTIQEAARQVGCPPGTVASRLARGRALLGKRLAARGATLSGTALALVLSQAASAAASVPAGLVGATVTAASATAAGVVPAQILALTEGVLKGMFLIKLKAVAGVLALAALVGLGTVGVLGVGPGPGQALAQPQPEPVWKERRSAVGHTDRVDSVAFSPDGTVLATASADHSVRLWDAATGQEIRTLAGHTDGVQVVVFSPDGKLLASAGNDRHLYLIEPATGKQQAKLVAGPAGILAVAFSPAGKLVGAASADGTVRIWEVATGKEVAQSKLAGGPRAAVAFSPDGTRLAASDRDGIVRIWDVEAGKERQALVTPHKTGLWTLRLAPTGKTLVAGGRDGVVTVWDLGAAEKPRLVLPAHKQAVRCVAISPDGRWIASGSQEEFASQLRLWDMATGKLVGTHEFERGGDVTAVVFSPDGKTLACVSRGAGVRRATIHFFEPARK